MKKTVILFYCISISGLILVSGCAPTFARGNALPTPTIIPLLTVQQAASTPTPAPTSTATPTATMLPATLPPAAPISTSGLPSPTPITTVATPSTTAVTWPSNEASATEAALAGTWDFNFGTLSLTQRSARVEGEYRWYGDLDFGQVEGVFIDDLNQFQGLWVSNKSPMVQGFLRAHVEPDRHSFSGVYEYSSARGPFCGVRSGELLPAGCGFSGSWQLRFGSPPGLTGQATLQQTGRKVEGWYTGADGRTGDIVDGVITVLSNTEAKLTGTWRNDRGESDSFDWRLDLTTGRTFQGRRDPGNSEWCGWRPGTDEPQPCGWED